MNQWNSNFDIFQQFVQIKKCCVHYCKDNSKSKQFYLNNKEWDQEANIMNLLKPFYNIDSTKLGCTVTVHAAQLLCQKIYICKHVEFGWQLAGWSMLNVNCRQLIKFFLQ